jgi:hypothetical protein
VSRTGVLLFAPPTGQQPLASPWQETAGDEKNVQANPKRSAPVHQQVEHGRNLLSDRLPRFPIVVKALDAPFKFANTW